MPTCPHPGIDPNTLEATSGDINEPDVIGHTLYEPLVFIPYPMLDARGELVTGWLSSTPTVAHGDARYLKEPAYITGSIVYNPASGTHVVRHYTMTSEQIMSGINAAEQVPTSTDPDDPLAAERASGWSGHTRSPVFGLQRGQIVVFRSLAAIVPS